MNDFNPDAVRAKQMRKAKRLAKLRAADPKAADRLVLDVAKEPDPVQVHIGVLKRNFPNLHFLHRPWGRSGLPSLQDLANLATLRAHFSAKKRSAPTPRNPEVERAEAFALFAARFGRRSIWSRLAFWQR